MARRRKVKRPPGHTSVWPPYYPSKLRDRTLAFILPVYDNDTELIVAYTLVMEDKTRHIVSTLDELLRLGFTFNLDIYTVRLFGKRGFIWFRDAIQIGAEAILTQSSHTVSMISFKGRLYNSRRVLKVISVRSWGYTELPSSEFIDALRNVFNEYKHGVYPSAASLGHVAMVMWHKKQGKKRYHRPSVPLRHKLMTKGSGGRKDDFGLFEQVGQEYISDINNSYAAQSIAGVPVSGCEHVGMGDMWSSDLTQLEEYKACFMQARITITPDNIRKFSPFYIRDEHNQLRWQNKPGVYVGWWWSKMIVRCLQAGYKVEMGFAYCWRDLDTFLAAWVYEIVGMREHFKELGLELEEQLSKRIIVSAIGCFAIHDTKSVIVAARLSPDDEPFLDLEVEGYESMRTPYFIHVVINLNDYHLTQVAYFIIMCNNIELYDRCIAEELAGNMVLRTYYDMVATRDPPTQPLSRDIGAWKQK